MTAILPTLEERIAHAKRLQQFLADPLVATALTALERRYYEEYLSADSSEKRVTAWAKGNVLRDLNGALKAVLDDGEMAKDEKNRKEKDHKK